jgi:hypothetical protein
MNGDDIYVCGYGHTGSANYYWTTFKWPGMGLNIVFKFFAFQTKYSLASVGAETVEASSASHSATGEELSGH